VAAFALLFVAPALEAAVDAGSSRCCRRGVCCHHRSAADTTCIRGVCPCGGHDRGTPASPACFDALMPRVSAVFSDDAAVARPRDPAVTPQAHDSTPPHGPPRLSL